MNEVLVNHVSHRYYGVDKDICQINCYGEPGCVSYNHGTLSDGTFLCELNDKDHTQASSNEMVARYGFIYRPILVRDDVINKLYSPMKRLEAQKNDPLSNSINFLSESLWKQPLRRTFQMPIRFWRPGISLWLSTWLLWRRM